jgi:uncharacterized protein YndB with AHSA1/START domain
MKKVGQLTVDARGDNEIVMTRVFDAPRRLVFDAWTKPELLQRWLGVRAGWTMPVCEIDLRVGGAYRFVWKKGGGPEMGLRGVYREIVAPERIVSTERFDDPWYPGEGLNTLVLVEKDGRTTLTTVARYETREARDGVLASPMATGVAESYDALVEVLATMPAAKK